MAAHSFDVLVVGSGASGLAAPCRPSGPGHGSAGDQGLGPGCNSAKAQGGIQAAFGEDDSPEIHAEDVMRSSHDTANPRLVEVLTSEAPDAIHWLEGLGVEFTRERWLPVGALRRRDTQAAAAGGRPDGARDHEGAAGGVRGRGGTEPRTTRSRDSSRRARLARDCTTKDGSTVEIEAGAVVLAAGGRCYAEATGGASRRRIIRTPRAR